MKLKMNPDFLQNQILLAPALTRDNRPTTIEVVLQGYLKEPVVESLDGGEKVTLDCVIHYPSLGQTANACSACLHPAPLTS